ITGHEWVVTLKFRVVRNAFRKESLDAQLRLAPFHEASPPVLCDTPPVGLLNFPGGVQEGVIPASTDDLDTPAFHPFLGHAVASYQKIGRGGALVTASELL